MLFVCTTLGGLIAETGDDGALSGTVAGATVDGTERSLRVVDDGVVLFRGPLEALEPAADPLAQDPRVAVKHLRAAGALSDCRPERVRVGAWPDPIEVAGRVVRLGPADVVLRGPDGATRLVSLPMDRALAAALAAELEAAFPAHGTSVRWADGIGLLAVSDGSVPEGVAPAGEAPGVLALLGIEPAPAEPPTPALSALGGGAEAAAWVAAVRGEAGLQPLRWDDLLAESALQHAAYLAETGQRPPGHRQDPKHPLYAGETPEQRGGARELVALAEGPAEAVRAWLGAPYHRVPLLHPHAVAIGVANVGNVWVAEVATVEGVVPPGKWPPDGELPAALFDGKENPDPLPLWKFQDRVYPVGYPLTVLGVRPRSTRLVCDREKLEHRVADPALGSPIEAWHLMAHDPLLPGARCTWEVRGQALDGTSAHVEGAFTVPFDRLEALVALPEPVAAAVREANRLREQAGHRPLRATRRADAVARLAGGRTRAMQQGLDPGRVRGVLLAPGLKRPLAQVCVRPGEPFPVDELLLDRRYGEVAADTEAVVVTWSTGPEGPKATLAGPRTCAILLQ